MFGITNYVYQQHMSTESDDDDLTAAGVPELSSLGKRIEHLRLERRMSKRILAQRAGTSRQQLWRVMTGKSELTSSLCARLAEVLETDSRVLRGGLHNALERAQSNHAVARPWDSSSRSSEPERIVDDGNSAGSRICQTLEDYITSAAGLERTFDTLPATADGRRLKRVLLDAIEDIAITRAIKVPQAIFDLRRAVVNDDS